MSFKDYPTSVTEARADKSEDASEWTPRDVLIRALRQVDGGTLAADAMIICYRRCDGHVGFIASSPDLETSLGLLERVKGGLADE